MTAACFSAWQRSMCHRYARAELGSTQAYCSLEAMEGRGVRESSLGRGDWELMPKCCESLGWRLRTGRSEPVSTVSARGLVEPEVTEQDISPSIK